MLKERLKSGGDEGEREVGGILAGVMNSVEDAIRETEGENEKTTMKIVNGKLRGLKIQANHLKKFAENTRGYKKMTKIQADRIRVVFDIKPEEEDTMEMLKTETENNYRVKFEKFRSG